MASQSFVQIKAGVFMDKNVAEFDQARKCQRRRRSQNLFLAKNSKKSADFKGWPQPSSATI